MNKLKSILFGLITITFLTVLLTSCENENLISEVEKSENYFEDDFTLLDQNHPLYEAISTLVVSNSSDKTKTCSWSNGGGSVKCNGGDCSVEVGRNAKGHFRACIVCEGGANSGSQACIP